jgi:glycosyltransferase involved in cell wall biosynthesis
VELTDVIDRIARQGADVRAAMLKGGYRNINYPEDYISAMNLYRKLHFDEYRISLVIPTFNEATAIGEVIDEFKDKVHEIVVADNQSPDGTGAIAREKGATVISQHFAGYGDALRCALRAASGDILVLMEGDASFTADDLPKILAYMRDADMVIGTRTTKQMIEQGANMDAFLRWGNVMAAKVLQFLWIWQEPRFTDLGCTYRAIWRDTYLTIRDSLTANGPEFSPEMMVEVLRAERKIIEIPVTYRPRIGDVSKHSGSKLAILKTGSKMLALILKRRLGLR